VLRDADLVDSSMPEEELYILRAFMPGGWLSSHLPDYVMREGQLRLAQRIDAVFRHSKDLVAEGPTGIGKSLAYAVPLAYRTGNNSKRGLIVTANIALQEQLMEKDLPLLQKALPWKFSFVLHKGRNNYLCLDAAKNLLEKESDGRRRLMILDEKEGHDQYLRIINWGHETKTGDVSELPFEPKPNVWSKFSVTSEECSKQACSFYRDCWANKAFSKISEADIVVTNYHIFFAHLRMGKAEFGYDYIIFDEAHKAADIAREFFGFKINHGTLKWLVGRLGGEPFLQKNLEASATTFFYDLDRYMRSGDYRTRIKDSSALRAAPLQQQLEQAANIFKRRLKHQQELSEKAENDSSCSLEEKLKLRRTLFDASRCWDTTEHLRTQLLDVMRLDPDYVYYLEEDRGHATLVAKKIDISEQLEKALWDRDPNNVTTSTQSLVLLSATMSVGGSFDHIMKELGIPHVNTDLFAAESPFDWQKQAMLVVPEEFTDPKDDQFRIQVGMALAYIVEQARGRTLCLFTSWMGLNVAYELLKPRCKYRILKQGDMPRAKLIEEFKKDKDSILLGVESFWQGIDVPGDSLACVVIDKLPFPSPEDPILDVMQERFDAGAHDYGKGPFYSYSVPRMALSIKQGFGRLIRSVSDRGVVVILDKRVHTQWNRYGKILLNSLPPVPHSVDLDDIGRFLK
jgi:ATP-dependent DNA helicase DinG